MGHPEGVRQVRAMGADQQRSSVHPLHLHTREKISFGTGSEEDAFGPSPLPTREHATAAVYWERPSPLASRSAACSQIAAWPLVTSTLRRALGNAPRMWRMILRRTDASHQKLPYRSGDGQRPHTRPQSSASRRSCPAHSPLTSGDAPLDGGERTELVVGAHRDTGAQRLARPGLVVLLLRVAAQQDHHARPLLLAGTHLHARRERRASRREHRRRRWLPSRTS